MSITTSQPPPEEFKLLGLLLPTSPAWIYLAFSNVSFDADGAFQATWRNQIPGEGLEAFSVFSSLFPGSTLSVLIERAQERQIIDCLIQSCGMLEDRQGVQLTLRPKASEDMRQ